MKLFYGFLSKIGILLQFSRFLDEIRSRQKFSRQAVTSQGFLTYKASSPSLQVKWGTLLSP